MLSNQILCVLAALQSLSAVLSHTHITILVVKRVQKDKQLGVQEHIPCAVRPEEL